MSRTGPIVIIDDDADDHEMIERILVKLKVKNEVKKFRDGEDALEYLKHTKDKPFIIICDINMPRMNGLQLKETIDKNPVLRMKGIPFVILSTAANPKQIVQAYQQNVQGFFVKGESLSVLQNSVTRIIEYWQSCLHPNNI